MDPIEAEFSTKGVCRGSELFLPPAEAIRLVGRYRDAGIAILGADGFILTEDATYPQLDQILDLSGAIADDTWSQAEAFLKERLPTSFMFVVVANC